MREHKSYYICLEGERIKMEWCKMTKPVSYPLGASPAFLFKVFLNSKLDARGCHQNRGHNTINKLNPFKST